MLFAFLFSFNNSKLSAQCTNSSFYPSTAFAAPTSGTYEISTCNYQSEYNQMDGAVAGSSYVSTASIAGTFITVRAGSYNGAVAGMGTTPLTWTATAGGTYFIHYNVNAACGTASSCMTTTITKSGSSVVVPTVQDCDGAIPLCFATYSNSVSYSGTGNYPTEISTTGGCPANCLLSGEKNDVWYTFTVQNSGTVSFSITPNSSTDDYDWAVYNLTNANCADIYSNPSLQVSCNYSAADGTTGPNGLGSNSCESATGGLNNAALNVTTGQTYVVNVSNFTSSQWGYSINFGGTAQVVDNSGPYLYAVAASPVCGQNSVTIRFSENVKCNTVQSTDFTVSGPGGPYTVSSVTSPICTAGGVYDRDYTLTVSPAFTSGGTYTISLVNNSVSDVCNNSTGGQVLNFSVTGVNSNASVVSNVNCFGQSNGSATGSGSGGTAPYTYSWSNGATTATASGLAVGTYTVTVRDAIGVCNAVSSVNITQPTNLTSTVTKANVSCNGGNNGTASVSALGGTPGYTYSWSTGSTASSISGLTAATYTVTVTDSHGCISVGSATLTQPTLLLTVISTQINVGCSGGNNGSATVTASNGTPGYTYSWSNGQTAATAINLVAGTYTVTVRDANLCSSTKSVTITQPVALTSSISGSTQVLCFGGNNGSATVTQSGGTPGYTYTWSNTQTTVTAINLVAGTYTVTVRDANTCSSVASITITQPIAVSATLSKTNVSCNGGNNGTATATPSGGTPGYTYTWSNGQTTQTATGLSAIAYSVTVKDANNCSVVQSITVTQPTILSSSISSSTNIACNGGNNGTATAAGSGGTPSYTYTWSNGQTVATASSLSVGTYTVTVRDANNCSSISSVTISQPTSITASTSSVSVLCNGGSTGTATANPSGGTPGYTYLWSNAQTGATATGLISGTYSVTVKDVNLCSTTASVTVNQPTALSTSISSSTNVSCNGGNNGSATVASSGGTPSYTYLWSNAQTGATATGLIAGTYSVTVRDANNCSSIRSVTITQPLVLAATASATNTSCNSGSNGTATATPSGGTSPFTYNWFPSGQTTQTATNLSAGTYNVTVTDNRGCTIVRSATVSQPGAIALTPSFTNATCGNSNGSASVSALGGTPGYTYLWSNGGTTSTISAIIAGSYTVTVRDVNNCSSTSTVAVNNTGAPTVTPTSSVNVNCFGGATGSASISASGGTPGYTYLWSNGATGTSITNVVANNYSVTVTDALGCKASTSINITQPTVLVASVTGNTSPLCFGANNGNATVSASGGSPAYTYLWSNGASTASASSLTVGTYTVTVTDSHTCTKSTSVTVTQPTVVSGTISSSTAVSCNGGSNGSATVSPAGGTPSYTYLWSQGTTTAAVTNLIAGTYSVTIRDVNNCSSTASLTITQPSALSSSIANTIVSCNGGSNGTATITVLGGSPAYTYLWSNSQTTAIANGLSSGTYTVTTTDSHSCTHTNSVTISQPLALSSSISGSTNVLCNGGSTGTATVTQSGGTPTFTYLWSNGQTTTTATGLSVGTYTVTVRDANNCTSVSSSIISQPTALVASISTSTNVSCNGGNNGSAIASPSGGTPSYTYLWSNAQTTSTSTSLTAGTYTVTIRDVNNCTSTTSIVITQPAVLTSSISASTQVSCNGGNNGSATVAQVGGTASYTYTWSNGQANATASNLVAGTYTVTVKDANNCTSSSVVTITQPTQLTSTISASTNVSCNSGSNGTATVLPAGGSPSYLYLWSNSQTTATATGLSSGSYSVTVTDNKGCTTTSTVTINQPTALTSSISASSQVLCFSGSSGTATVTQSGGTPSYTYLWSNSQTTGTATGLAIGTYTVTVRDVNNCTSTSSVTITQPTLLSSVISSSSNVACNGGNNGSATVLPSGGTPSYTYFWSTGQAVATTTGLTAGIYTVTVTDANNCTTTKTVTITQPALLTNTNTVVNTTCNGGSNGSITANPSGGSIPYTFSWFPSGQTTQIATGLAAGNYQVTVSDSHSCSEVNSVTVSQPAAISLSSTFTNATCGNSNGSASVSASGGTPGYTYLWSNGGTNSSISAIVAGSYTVTVKDVNNCSSTTSVSVNNTGAPSVSLVSSNNVSCNGGANGSAVVTVTGGTLPYASYLWSNGATDTLINNVAANNYSITITDALGCQATLSINIIQPTVLIASIIGTTLPTCYGLANGTASVNANGGSPNYFYSWSNGANSSTAINLIAGTYSVTVTDLKGCTSVATANVSQPSQVSGIISSYTNTTCNGGSDGSATVAPSGGTPGYTYLWSDGSSTATATNLSAGNYVVTITDSNSCTAIANTTINQPANLQVNIPTISPVNCFGGSDGLANASTSGGTGPYTYIWSNGVLISSNSGLIAGSYQVTATDSHGCTGTNSVIITEPSQLVASANTISTVSCFGGSNGSASASAVGGSPTYSYHWFNGSSNANTGGLSAGAHSVTITDINFCTSIATVTITEPALLVATFISDSALCNNTATGQIDLTAAGGTSPYTYHWNDNSVNEDLSNIIAGNYLVTVTDANFCSTTQTISVYQPTIVTATFVPVSSHCNLNDGSLTVSPVGGTPNYSYLWDASAAGQTTSLATNLLSGTYNVTVTDSHSCSYVFSGSVSDLNAATLTFDIVTPNPCYGDSLGYVHSVITSGGTPPFNYLWSNGAVADTLFNVGSGNYTLTLTDVTGCITIESVDVLQPGLLQANIDSLHPVSCYNGNDGSMIVSMIGGTSGFTYIWQDGVGNTISNNNTIVNQSAGVYYITVTDSHNCIFNSSYSLPQATELISTIAAPIMPNCSNSNDGQAISVATGGTAPYSFLWNDLLNTANDTILTLGGTNDYFVTVTDFNGCTTIDSVHIDAPLAIQITGNSFQSTCIGSDGWAYVEVTGGTPIYNFLWSNSSVNDTVTNLAAGNYTVTVYDSHACTSTYTATINSINAGQVQIDNVVDVNCYGDSTGSILVSLSGGTAPFIYNWNNGANTDSLINLSSGVYSVTITDGNGCVSDTAITINAPIVGLTSNFTVAGITCNGSSNGILSTNVSGGTSPYSYLWNTTPALTTPSITGLFAGSYSVSVTDAKGCSLVEIGTIAEPSLLVATTSSINPSCGNGSDGSSLVTAMGGTIPYTYVWSNNDQDSLANGLITGNYIVTVYDAHLCTTTATSQIFSPPSMVLDTSSGVNSITNMGFVNISVTGGGLPITYVWSNGATTANIIDLPAGEYIVTITDANLCSVVETFTIDIQLLIPSVITPNADGINDDLEIVGIAGYQDVTIEVYNRWGDIIYTFTGTGMEYTDPSKRWNGIYNGSDLPMGGYVYIVKIGKDKDPITGVVSIIR